MSEQLIKYFLDELSAEERFELFNRIEKDNRLKSEFTRLQNMNAVSHFLPRDSDLVEGREHFDLFLNNLKWSNRKKNLFRSFKYAAAVVILIALTIWTTLFFSDSYTEPTINTLYVPAGQRAQITLHDGTEIWLNAQSTLRYPSHFRNGYRKVEIIGEAFFDVAHDIDKPFIVSTQNIELLVLGTQFNVYSYPNAEYIQTDLLEGSLKIYQQTDKENNVVLKPNERVIVKGYEMSKEALLNPDHMLWRKGIYSFENEPLIDIIKKLELYYDIEIKVEEPEFFDVRYTGKFRQNDGVVEILHILQKIQHFNIERDRENNFIKLTK